MVGLKLRGAVTPTKFIAKQTGTDNDFMLHYSVSTDDQGPLYLQKTGTKFLTPGRIEGSDNRPVTFRWKDGVLGASVDSETYVVRLHIAKTNGTDNWYLVANSSAIISNFVLMPNGE